MLRSGRIADNADYLSPQEVLRASPAPAPLVLGPPDERRTFGAWALNEVRASVAAMLLAAGFGRDRADDVVLAVNEIATNAVEHGPGDAEVYLWSDADGFVAEVHDRGVLGNPLPGLIAPHPAEPRGRGRLDRAAALRLAARLGRRRRHARPAARGALTYGRIPAGLKGYGASPVRP